MLSSEIRHQQIREIMQMIKTQACLMPEFVFKYMTANHDESNYDFYKLMADAYLSLHAVSLLLDYDDWTQAGAVLRLAIEEVCKVSMMCKYKETLDEYIKIQKEKRTYYTSDDDFKKRFQIEKKLKRKHAVDNYFDYAFCKCLNANNSYGRNFIIKKMNYGDIIVDIEENLNAFAHGSATIFDYSGPNGTWELMGREGWRISDVCIQLLNLLGNAMHIKFGPKCRTSPISDIIFYINKYILMNKID